MMLCASYFPLSQSRLIFLASTGINPGNLLYLTTALLSIILNITVFSILFILNKTLNRKKKDEDSS